MTAPALLALRGVSVRFGGIVALDRLDLEVAPGTIHAVIGPNGAGKSTLINLVSGFYKPTSGAIAFKDRQIDGLSASEISRRGIARTFQNTELFGELSALENVMVPLGRTLPYGVVAAATHLGHFRRGEEQARREAREHLVKVGLGTEVDTPAAALSFGQQRRLEIARALATKPRLMLLDEPAAGLRSTEIEELNDLLRDLREREGLTMLLVDHVMRLVMRLSDRITVLNFGHKIAEGSPEEVRTDPGVVQAYLGRSAHAVGA